MLNEFGAGGAFENVKDAMMAIKYRLAFITASRLTMEVAKQETFFGETHEPSCIVMLN